MRRAGRVTMAVRAGKGLQEVAELLARTIEDPETTPAGRAACTTALLKVRAAMAAEGGGVRAETDVVDELATVRTRRRRSS